MLLALYVNVGTLRASDVHSSATALSVVLPSSDLGPSVTLVLYRSMYSLGLYASARSLDIERGAGLRKP